MSPTTELIGHLATGTLSAVVGGAIVLLVTWDRQVGIARAEYRMDRAERQSEELLRAALQVSDAVQPRAIEAGTTDDHMTGELLAVDGVEADETITADDLSPLGPKDDWRAPWWSPLATAAAVLLVALLLPAWLAWMAGEWLVGKARSVAAAWRRRRDERYLIGSGEQATSADPFAELLAHVEAKPIVLDPDDEAALQAEHKAWKAANPPTNHGPDGQRHWNDVTAMHGIVTPGRHAKMPINASIPTQRDGGES